ncbi:MAG: hypothetical protein IKH30_04585, partial [Clostridia bacterium]|nr:hypothetical protein [Clostridia bacterium]
LHIGSFIVIRKIISDYHLDEMIGRIIGQDAGLFLDLAAYSIINEDNGSWIIFINWTPFILLRHVQIQECRAFLETP